MDKSPNGSRPFRSNSVGPGKKRSPPPSQTARSRPHSPSPGGPPLVNGTSASASSSAFTARNAVSRSGYTATASTDYGATPFSGGAAGGVGMGMTDSPPTVTVDLSGEGQPLYAYSTTLRRQPSIEAGYFPRSSSPHAPYRKRTTSNPYANGLPMTNLDEEPGSRDTPSLIDRAASLGRRLLGKGDYDALRQREEEADEALAQRERRQRETPSSVYAHKTVDQTITDFRTHPTEGLSSNALAALTARYGLNEFEVAPSEPLWLKLAKQVYEQPLILMLLGSSVVSAFFGSYDDAICVLLAVGIVLTVAFVQEQRSEKSLEALNKLVPHYCHLIRNGQSLAPLANALLPGDLVTFSVGDRIPADIRIITSVSLEIDESALTGETRPSKKNTTMCERGEGEDTHGEGGGKALGERHCMAFMGTLVRSGHGSGIVVGTGKDTEFGVVFEMMQDVEEQKTPLQLAMDDLAKRLSFFSFGVIGVIFLIGVLQHRGWLEMFTIGVSLAVAAIPEGLPIVTTVTLALGVLRMSKRKAIVKKLPSVEALGSVSVICSDKTGTLTKNEMTVTQMYAYDDLLDLSPYIHTNTAFGPRPPSHPSLNLSPAIAKTALVGNLCNNSFRNEQGVFVGQATEVALLNVLPILNLDDERKNFVRKSEIPFSSETKTMTVSGSLDGGSEMMYMKGAVEAVLARCRYFYVNDSSTPSLDAKAKEAITARALESAKKGLRLIATAYGFAPKDPNMKTDDLIFCGFQAIVDPPRKGVAHAISSLHGAGVQMVMITGDAEPTALAIARDLGLKVAPPAPAGGTGAAVLKLTDTASSPSCMLGSQVDQLTERELIERVPSITVYARTTPRHKMAIVRAWQMRGAIVAMTGDGVNDSPALKMADIGISMGKSGTDVAKEAADVILVDDDFSSILPAVEEGKSIFYNIQNFLSFQLSTAVAALSLITLSTFFKLANPLNAMQILFINILMDGPPAQALGVDPVDREVMKRPPRRKDEPVLNSRLMSRVGFSATMMVLGTLFVYIYEVGDGSLSKRDQTMTFTTFVFLDLVSALQNRGLFTSLTTNRILILTLSISFLAQLGLVYIPLLQHIFQTEALGFRDLGVVVSLAGLSFGGHEVRRHYERVKEREGMGRGMVEGLV